MTRAFGAPESWRIVPLGEVAEVQTGVAKGKRPKNAAISVPYLRVANVQDGFLDLSEIKRIEIDPGEVPRFQLRSGDVLFTEGGDFDKLGRGTVWRGQIEPCVHQNHIFAVRPDDGALLPEFLAYVASSQIGKRYFVSCSKQTTNLASINSTQLKQFPIPIPSLSEQRHIADILATWDRAIDACAAVAAAESKEASWLRWEIARGSIKPGRWHKVQLREILREHCLLSTGEEEVFSVSVHRGLVNQVEHLGRSFSSGETHHYNRVLRGDIVYTKSPTGDFPYGIVKQNTNYRTVIVSPLYGVFTPLTYSIGAILDFLFESPDFAKNYLAPLIQKGAKNTINITNKRFLEGHILLSDSVVAQEKLAEVVGTVRAARLNAKKSIEAYRRQRDALASQLLTGQLRVRDAEQLSLAAAG